MTNFGCVIHCQATQHNGNQTQHPHTESRSYTVINITKTKIIEHFRVRFQKIVASSNFSNQIRFLSGIITLSEQIGFRMRLPSKPKPPTDLHRKAARGITSRGWNPSSAATVANIGGTESEQF